MPVTTEGFDQIESKLGKMFSGMAEDLKLVGQAGAEAIVRTTLAGIGEGDQAFAPYSPAYKELIDSVGGKPQQTVNLRGLFYHEGQQRKRYRSEARRLEEREGRQAYRSVTFNARTLAAMAAGGKAVVDFTAMSGITRPALGVNDPRSEMSLDLIKIETTDTSITLIYRPREQDYMIDHQEGNGKMPKRVWFTVKKKAVWDGMKDVLARVIRARVQWFNDHSQTGSPPSVGKVGDS